MTTESKFCKTLPESLLDVITQIETDPLHLRSRSRHGKQFVSISQKLKNSTRQPLECTLNAHMFPCFAILGAGVSLLSDTERMLIAIHKMRINQASQSDLTAAVYRCVNLTEDESLVLPLYIQIVIRKLYINLDEEASGYGY
mgnify:CR=1 FL=1